jgi:FAD/FMN-containing dehydrogenase
MANPTEKLSLLRPSDAGYEEGRKVWNGIVDRRPAAIARCRGVADILDAMAYAEREGLPMSLKAGGHSYPGYAIVEGGLVLDLSPMKSVRVDQARQTAHVQPGLTWGELDRETAVFGLATPGGVISSTGVAGLTLGGGIGWLTRKYGTSCDNLVSVDVVTADRRCIRASATENADLFWAIRGGGGNFGIVTSFEFKLHPLTDIYGGPMFFPAAKAKEVIQVYRDFVTDAPEELAAVVLMRNAPPTALVPEAIRGTPVIAMLVFYCGDPDDGDKVLAPVVEKLQPRSNQCKRRSYVDMQQLVDGGVPYGLCRDGRAHYLRELPDAAIDMFVEYCGKRPTPMTQGLLTNMLGGAARRVPESETAFPHRNVAFNFEAMAQWANPVDAASSKAWTTQFTDAMRPWSTGGVYVNFLQDEAPDLVRTAYGDKYARLQDVKTKYDPKNVFRFNPNILPR